MSRTKPRLAPGRLALPPSRALPALLGVLQAACATSPPPAAPFDFRSAVGVAVSRPGRACVDIRNPALEAGRRIRFVTTSPPQTAGEAEVTGRSERPCAAEGGDEPGLFHYELAVTRGALPPSVPAIAVAAPAGAAPALTASPDGVTFDLDGDGREESFRSCASAEGVHLTVWTGKPLEGRRRWHFYYALGYDVEAGCTDADTRPDAP